MGTGSLPTGGAGKLESCEDHQKECGVTTLIPSPKESTRLFSVKDGGAFQESTSLFSMNVYNVIWNREHPDSCRRGRGLGRMVEKGDRMQKCRLVVTEQSWGCEVPHREESVICSNYVRCQVGAGFIGVISKLCKCLITVLYT